MGSRYVDLRAGPEGLVGDDRREPAGEREVAPPSALSLASALGNQGVQRMLAARIAPRPGSAPAVSVQRGWDDKLKAFFGAKKELRLELGPGRSIVLTKGAGPYYKIEGTEGHIHKDALAINAQTGAVTANETELATQITRYLAGTLSLYRGVQRNHPHWYEVRYGSLLMPIGTGEVGDFETNLTRLIPFGPDQPHAEGIAIGLSNMGPGDLTKMVADYRPDDPEFEIGLVLEALVPAGGSAYFYSPGEIQLSGPITKFTIRKIVKAGEFYPGGAGAPAVPSGPEQATYAAVHGGARHGAIVAAVAGGAPRQLAQLGQAPPTHSYWLFAMRQRLIAKTAVMLDDVARLASSEQVLASAALALGGDARNFKNRLDASLNRVAHEHYLAAWLRGAEPAEAANAGIAQAADWLANFHSRYLVAVGDGAPQATSPHTAAPPQQATLAESRADVMEPDDAAAEAHVVRAVNQFEELQKRVFALGLDTSDETGADRARLLAIYRKHKSAANPVEAALQEARTALLRA